MLLVVPSVLRAVVDPRRLGAAVAQRRAGLRWVLGGRGRDGRDGRDGNRRTPSDEAHFVVLDLEGDGVGGRDAIGARVRVQTSGGLMLAREVSIGASLGTGGSSRLHFSLGSDSVASVTVQWPDGTVESFPNVPATDVWHVSHPRRRPPR